MSAQLLLLTLGAACACLQNLLLAAHGSLPTPAAYNARIGNIDHFDYEIVLNGLGKLAGIAQLDPSKNSKETKAYKNDGYLLPKELDEKAACLHLPALRRNSLITLGFINLLLAQPASTDSEHSKQVKNNAIIGNVGHFGNEIDMNGLTKLVGIAQLDPSKHSKETKACKNGYLPPKEPNEKDMNGLETLEGIAQLDPSKNSKETKAYKNDEYLPPKELDEKAACLHKSVDASAYFIAPDEDLLNIAYPTMLFERNLTDAIIGNIGHFDNEIDMNGLDKLEGIAQLDPSKNSKETKAYKNDGYLPPKELDEKAACLHLPALRRNSLVTLEYVNLLLALPASADLLAEPSCCLRQPSDFSCPWQPSTLLESFETSSATAATSHCTGVG